MSDERRRFKRLPIPDDTIAVDSQGRELGRVTTASGGGIQISDLSEEGKRVLQVGKQVSVTIVEPTIGARHSAILEIRYRLKDRVGAEFVSGAAAGH